MTTVDVLETVAQWVPEQWAAELRARAERLREAIAEAARDVALLWPGDNVVTLLEAINAPTGTTRGRDE